MEGMRQHLGKEIDGGLTGLEFLDDIKNILVALCVEDRDEAPGERLDNLNSALESVTYMYTIALGAVKKERDEMVARIEEMDDQIFKFLKEREDKLAEVSNG